MKLKFLLLVLQLPGADAGKPDVKGAAEKAVKKIPLGFMNVEELAFELPGSNVSKDDLPINVKPGDAAGLPKGPTAKPPTLPSLPKVSSEYSSFVKLLAASHGLMQYAMTCNSAAVSLLLRVSVTISAYLSH